MRGLLPWILAMSCWFYAHGARAVETVVLFEVPGLRPELCAALRIQLTDVASVECRPGAEGALPERLGQASRVVGAQGAELGVLLERDPDPALVRMMLVGARPDQAVLEIERIEDRPDPDIDRSLALKVRDAVEVMHATEPSLRSRAPLAPMLVPTPVSAPGRALLLEVGGGPSFGRKLRAAGVAGFGLRRARERSLLEGVLSGQLTSRIDDQSAAGHIDASEWGVSLGARVARRFERASVGALLEVGITRLLANGRTDAGSDGDAQLTRPRTAVGLDLRVALTRGLHLRLAPTFEFYPIEQSFALNGDERLNLGHFRALLPLSLVVDIPLLGKRSVDAN